MNHAGTEFSIDNTVVLSYRASEPDFTLEKAQEYCDSLCLSIHEKYNKILLLKSNIASRQILLTNTEVRFYICSLLELTLQMKSFGFILSCMGIFYYKLVQWGCRIDSIQISSQEICEAKEIIVEEMNFLFNLLTAYPELIERINLPDDVYDYYT